MLRSWIRRLAYVYIVCVLGIIGYLVVGLLPWQERPDSATNVAVQLKPAQQTIRGGGTPSLTLTIVNRGSQAVTLLEPGDGSDFGWRTPIIEWSYQQRRRARCGNRNPMEADEVFSLKPGESRELNGWTGQPYLPRPGRYQVAVRYTNQPSHPWIGVSLGDEGEAIRRAVRGSTAISAVSNTVVVVVAE